MQSKTKALRQTLLATAAKFFAGMGYDSRQFELAVGVAQGTGDASTKGLTEASNNGSPPA